MASREQLVAVNRMVKAAGLDEAVFGVVILAAQGLARRVDAAGGIDKAPMDTVKAYLSASKDLQRAAASTAAAKRGRGRVELPADVPGPDPSQPPQLHAVEEGPLAKLRRQEAARATHAQRREGAAG